MSALGLANCTERDTESGVAGAEVALLFGQVKSQTIALIEKPR